MEQGRFYKFFVEYDFLTNRMRKEFHMRYDSPDLKPNANINDFDLIKTLGAGTFGRVILAKHKVGDTKLYAIKCIEKTDVMRTKQIEHTKNEIRILDAINFEFIVNLEYFFKDNVYIFLAMPYVLGGDLYSHLRVMRKFDEVLSRFFAAQVILAIEYLHFLGIIFRDLKPENILMDHDGYLKLTDMGFAKKIDGQRTYTLCGTPGYLAPEVIMGKGYNKSVDWWTIGVLIFEMSAGRLPFYDKNTIKMYEKIIEGSFTCPLHFTNELADLVSNILQVDRTKRYGILKNGSRDVKDHKWFKSINFYQVLKRRMKPIYKPKVNEVDLSSNLSNLKEQPLKTCDKELYASEFAEINTIDQ